MRDILDNNTVIEEDFLLCVTTTNAIFSNLPIIARLNENEKDKIE